MQEGAIETADGFHRASLLGWVVFASVLAMHGPRVRVAATDAITGTLWQGVVASRWEWILIIYAMVANASVGQLFMGGVVRGLVELTWRAIGRTLLGQGLV